MTEHGQSKLFKNLAVTISAGVAFAGSIILLIQTCGPPPTADLSGEWILNDSITEGNFAGTVVGFHITLIQHGETLTGTGRKWCDNRSEVTIPNRIPLKITEGKITGDQIIANFEESGRQDTTTGTFDWTRVSDDSLIGTFSSDAFSGGTSILVRADTSRLFGCY